MSPPHAKVPPRVPVCSAAPRSLLDVFSVEQEVHGSSWRWDIPWNCPQDDRGTAAVTWKQQQRRRSEKAEPSRLSAHWHKRKPGREAGCRSACTVTCSGSMTPEPSIMSDSGSQAVVCHLVYGTWAWLSRFPLLDDNRVDGVVGRFLSHPAWVSDSDHCSTLMHVQWDSSFAVLSEGRKSVELLISWIHKKFLWRHRLKFRVSLGIVLCLKPMHHARVLVTRAGWLLLIEFFKEIFL